MLEFWIWFALFAAAIWFLLVVAAAMVGGFFVIWGLCRTVRWGTSVSGRWRR